MTLDQLNALYRAEFTRALGAIFEHSPWVPERVADARPFADVRALHAAMCAAVRAASEGERMALIRAHPQLAGKAAIRGELTAHSAREQSGAGLDQCSPEEYARLTELNAAYDARFGFPFIIAVKGHTRASIIEHMARRVSGAREVEVDEALRQIERIAAFRLGALLGVDAPVS